ncbi:MAG TPA: hypothetical protein VK815_05610 [Candidatus Acidoferrales bacterium]|jgi:hypothetical protein|nr:hypothetical protein [Candidatus Acidoferrales bacterium]
MKLKLFLAVILAGLTCPLRAGAQTNALPVADTNAPTVETIVCIRHGEKPPGGLGQLTCRGLNRALALPEVLLGKYGKPQFVFAPNPTQKVDGKAGYNYIRPLMTIEPTAIRCGLPVNTQYGYLEIKELESELQKPEYRSAVVFVAWEHGLLDKFVKNVVKDNGGDDAKVPIWQGSDFDSIFLIKIVHASTGDSVEFTIEHENLNGLSDECPLPHP